MRYIILDIETIGHPDAAQWLEPIEPGDAPANYKDPEKIAAYVAEAHAKAVAARDGKLGLDPDCCQIVALGWHVVGGDDPTCLITKDEAEEAEALRQFADAYAAPQGQQETRIVTFYGRAFDLPVTMRRAMWLGIKFPAFNLDRYRSPHIDLYDVLTYNGALRQAHSLAFYGKRGGWGTLDKVDGADVATLAKAGDWDAIRDHCLSDIGLCHALANRLGLLRVS